RCWAESRCTRQVTPRPRQRARQQGEEEPWTAIDTPLKLRRNEQRRKSDQVSNMANERLLQTTVVGSYPQPDWLVNREMLSKVVPRTRLKDIWRVSEPYLEQAQDDATVLAIRDLERAGIDIITDGEMRRESYSNRFATALD